MPKVYDAQGTGFEFCNAQGASKPLSTLCSRRFRGKASAPSSAPLRVSVVVVGRSHGSRVAVAVASLPRGAALLLGRAPPLCPFISLLNLLYYETPVRIEVRHRRESPAPGAAQAPPHQGRCGTATVATGRGAQRRWATPRPAERSRRLPVRPSSAERAALPRGATK
ncbi:uncharacterized protein Tco025E_02604 [Trypanosoma conorhini]|uniref:Uncharacterized protein n=1 Tax=Trypanosoma conorhini TaxID=83891 RepID=A0A3S5IU01_9TRYP|nr:uncharacterized protein Tco025E_02604 [Trypanosoma conorhini]RNF24104.1 hypothetical protein Tco025E_02604 [Trypanosoma conorhini]